MGVNHNIITIRRNLFSSGLREESSIKSDESSVSGFHAPQQICKTPPELRLRAKIFRIR